MKRGYYKQEAIVKKHWYGNETETKFIPVLVISQRLTSTNTFCAFKYLIELPKHIKKEVWENELYLINERK